MKSSDAREIDGDMWAHRRLAAGWLVDVTSALWNVESRGKNHCTFRSVMRTSAEASLD